MRSTILLAAASLTLFSFQSSAATTHAAAVTTKTTVAAKPVAPAKPEPAAKPVPKSTMGSMMSRLMSHRAAAAPAPHAAPAAHVATTAAAARRTGRLVTTKTKTGKTVTYNCSLAGNASKAACKA